MNRAAGVLAGLALLAGAAAPARGQRIGTDVFGYLGYTRTTFTEPAAADLGQSWVNGPIGGVGVRVPVTGPAGFRGELLLARRGGAFALPEFDGGDATAELELVYLEVPLQLQFQSYRRGGGFRPFAYAGLVPAFRIGCDAEVRAGSLGVVRGDCVEALEEQPEWFELGAAGGLGLEYRQRRTLLQLQARYYQGFSDLGPRFAVANRTFAIVFGVGM